MFIEWRDDVSVAVEDERGNLGCCCVANTTVWLNQDGGTVFVGPFVPGMSSTSLPWTGALAPDAWHHLALRYAPASGAVRLTVDDEVLVDGVASAQLTDPLAVSIDGGLSGTISSDGPCTVLQDDIYLAPGSDE
jgi:hypothetical protein